MSFAEQLGEYKKEGSQKVRKVEVSHLNHVWRPEMTRKTVAQKIPHHERYGWRRL